MQDQNQNPSNDLLEQANAALRQAAIAAGPSAETIARARQISGVQHFTSFVFRLAAACLALFFLALAIWLVPQHSAGVAFADVVQTINQTHTFTGLLQGPPPDDAHISVKGSKMRLEDKNSVTVFDFASGKLLRIFPAQHRAMTTEEPAHQFDLYGWLHDYQTGSEKSVGEKMIHGKKAQGFQLKRALPVADQHEETLTFWVDPDTKLPVQVEDLPMVITDLHFDVPLDDSLFDMNVPSTYATEQNERTKPGDWDQTQYSGQVTDERGNPVANVEVSPTVQIASGGMSWIAPKTETDGDGKFSFPREFTKSPYWIDSPVRLEFRSANFLYGELGDMQLIAPEERINLRVRLRDGKSVSGKVIDSTGKAVAGAMVEAVIERKYDLEFRFNNRKAVLTDADGKFELRGLPSALAKLQVLKSNASPILCGANSVDLQKSDKCPDIVAQPFDIPAQTVVHELLGMKLVDIDQAIKDQLGLVDAQGVLILDQGVDTDRLGIGKPEAGDYFWMVGQTRVGNFDEFAKQLLAECETQNKNGRRNYSVRVVYTYRRVDSEGTNTQFMNLTDADLAETRKVVPK